MSLVPPQSSNIGERLRAILTRIEAACEGSGRSASEVTLIGASKRQSAEKVREAQEAGLTVVGENRVQEAELKQPLVPTTPPLDWHLIGPLQSNKAKRAVRLFSAVHSIDRVKIARTLDREAAAFERSVTGFLEINLGEEPTKHGFRAQGLSEVVRPLADLAHLEIVGLMAIPPRAESPSAAREWFRRLRELRDGICAEAHWSGCPGYLSMGMSADFELAIEEGATHVRVGTALFGDRLPVESLGD